MQVCVYGLGHLGQVTAACLATNGFLVVGLEQDLQKILMLKSGITSLMEPGLPELLRVGVERHGLTFSADAQDALEDADVLWVTFDTPVDAENQADVAFVRKRLEAIRADIKPGTLIVLSSQVPVGFTSQLLHDWFEIPLTSIVVSPENLRHGKAIERFNHPGRIVLGINDRYVDPRLHTLLNPFCSDLMVMSLESAEMTKHALNAYLAMAIVFTNELARLCHQVGADPLDIERGLRSDPRVGYFAPVTAGGPIQGGTLLRDVEYLRSLAQTLAVSNPVIDAIPSSNLIGLNASPA